MGFFNGKGKPEDEYTPEEVYADAERIRKIIRAVAAEFEPGPGGGPLTAVEQRAVSRVPPEYLGAAADLSEQAPDLSGVPPDAERLLRLAEAAERAFAPLADDVEHLRELICQAVSRKKSFAVRIARIIDRVSRALVASGAADWLEPYVDRLKRILSRPPHTPQPPKPKKK